MRVFHIHYHLKKIKFYIKQINQKQNWYKQKKAIK